MPVGLSLGFLGHFTPQNGRFLSVVGKWSAFDGIIVPLSLDSKGFRPQLRSSHNPEVGGSNPSPATIKHPGNLRISGAFPMLFKVIREFRFLRYFFRSANCGRFTWSAFGRHDDVTAADWRQ